MIERDEQFSKVCVQCGDGFTVQFPSQLRRKFCSNACSIAYTSKRRPKGPTTVKQPCDFCGVPFFKTATQADRGARFCSRKCYLEGRQLEYQEKIKDRACAVDGCVESKVIARGLCKRHYQQWRSRFGPSAKWTEKACPVCGFPFWTHTDRQFCSLACYVKSDVFAAARRTFAEKMRESWIKKVCVCCGNPFETTHSLADAQQYADGKKRVGKRFCSSTCKRRWYAERFDRFILDGPRLEVPESYDAFLSQSELPCLIDGCDWVGKNLSIHVNFIHGLKACDFKALAGFNRGTGVVCPETSKAMTDRNLGLNRGDPDFYLRADLESMTKPRGPYRAEAHEHHAKAVAMMRSTHA